MEKEAQSGSCAARAAAHCEAGQTARQGRAVREMTLDVPEAEHCCVRYEYSVLITLLGGDVRSTN
jgi:hypothetical protein